MLEQADEATFYQLAPHLFITTTEKEPLVVNELEATLEGYKHFKVLLREDK